MACLALLPTEVLQNLMRSLYIEDINNLRLASRNLSRKCSHGLVKSPVTVIWTDNTHLERFLNRTRCGRQGCLSKHLTIIGIVRSDAENDKAATATLAEAFLNFGKNSPDQSLESLKLFVRHPSEYPGLHEQDYRSEELLDWTPRWYAAARTFKVVMAALSASKLPVRRLDIFSDNDQCSLACDQLTELPDGLAQSLAGLTHLAWSLSCRVPSVGNDATEAQTDNGTHSGEQYGVDVRQILSLCPSLEGYHLRWYNLGGDRQIHGWSTEERELHNRVHSRTMKHRIPDGPRITKGFLDCLLPAETFRKLRACRMRGLYSTEATLNTFILTLHEVRKLDLEEIHVNGSLAPIFDTLTTSLAHLEHLYLDDFYENGKHIVFHGPGEPLTFDNIFENGRHSDFYGAGEPHYPISGEDEPQWPHDYRWSIGQGSREEKIRYGKSRRAAQGSTVTWYNLRKVRTYGPPRGLNKCRLVRPASSRPAPR